MILTLLATALSGTLGGILIPLHPAPDQLESSRVDLGGVRIEVEYHPVERTGSIRPPDLSHPGEKKIPGRAQLRTAAPLYWGGPILPPGEYDLGFVLKDELDLYLVASKGGSGHRHLLPLEIGDYSQPANAIRFLVAGTESATEHSGTFLVRWGALLIQGNFMPLRRMSSEHGGWRLVSYQFPVGCSLREEVDLGVLESSRSRELRRGVILITSDGGGATAAVNAAENQTAVTTVTATDADIPAQTLTFSISGGADQAFFGIVGGSADV